MNSDHLSEVEDSPGKMFVGLFVLIVVLAIGFLLVRLFTYSGEDSNGDSNFIDNPYEMRDPDGNLLSDPLDLEPDLVPNFNAGDDQ